MRLFQVPTGSRVRVTSKLIRWVEHSVESLIAEDVTWEGIVTDRYYHYKGAQRRLIVDHSLSVDEYGIWQKDKDVEIIADLSPREYNPKQRRKVLVG